MCNERTTKNEFYLTDSIRIEGSITDFNLFVENNLILEHCTNFSYVANKLFATKSGSNIHVFGTKVIKVNQKSNLEELAIFEIKSSKVSIQVMINETLYIIDYNCQVTFSNFIKYY
ncbi:MAG: hypothetical protein PHD15_00235 [Clostridia bacterium]|nr:hypothetical protein [Clostridia bacterium]MDD4386180.1 hypothetical protein [Clostridia bacterium]